MAGLIAILKALARAERRELGTFLSVRLNGLFLFAALLAYSSLVSHMRPAAAMPFFLLLGLLMLFPMSSDPLGRAPASRMALWPLTAQQRLWLRMATLGMNPLLWIAIMVLAATRQALAALLFLAVAMGARTLSLLGGRITRLMPASDPLRYIPQLPGKLGGLVRLSVRQILSVLDFYAALALTVGAIAYRWRSAHPEPDAFPILAMLVALALSTCAQCQFGLDPGWSRYLILPLRGWQVLLAKDLAFLLVLSCLVAPLNLGTGLTFGLAVVAVGRWPSLTRRLPQHRWRFTAGEVRFTVLQVVAGTVLAVEQSRSGPWFVLAAFVLYLVSLLLGGLYWERMRRRA
ncbi:MAG TPA: hypothetical protein VF532_11155 [Candidatus Angelobacter sp.]